jgi:Ca2+-binding EF-hand superfamily protein
LAFSWSITDVAAQDYRTWDRNGDGVVTRSEWRGTAQAFRERDWNRDGVISADELADTDWTEPGQATTFAAMDRNGDGRVNRGEWRGSRAEFVQADRNGDNMISRAEFMNLDAGYVDDNVGDFNALDDNRDGRIERFEWSGTRAAFNRMDVNNDGVLSRRELAASDAVPASAESFDLLDANNNGVISRGEWRTGLGRFTQYDVNRDGVISRREFANDGGGIEQQMFVVDVRQPWTDTGLHLEAGDTVRFRADGSSQLRTGTDDPATPAGSLTGRNATQSPRPDRPAGALLVRVGNTIEAVGANGTFTARSGGRLYFGVNDDHFPDNSGEYRVFVSVAR